MSPLHLARVFGIVSACALLFACDDPEGIVVECVDPGDSAPTGGWVCGEDKVIECSSTSGTAVNATLYAQLEEGSCDDAMLTASDTGPFGLGLHVISVNAELDESASLLPCTANLTIVDTTAPSVTPKTMELWPPNHSFHTITIEDCVDAADICDPDIEVAFTYATSDEPRNTTGDGNTEIDISSFGCHSIDLLAERKGNGDARVYRLGYRAVDASGNAAEGVCQVIVPHDQGGKVPVDSGEAYKELAPACH